MKSVRMASSWTAARTIVWRLTREFMPIKKDSVTEPTAFPALRLGISHRADFHQAAQDPPHWLLK